MPPTTPKTVTITNVRPFQSIGLDFPVAVAYTNGIAPSGNVIVTCLDANVAPPMAPAPGPSGSVTIRVTHALPDAGHTLSAVLKQDGIVVASCDITNVNVLGVPNANNDGPLTLAGYDGLQDGLPVVKTTDVLHGSFNPKVGNGVMLFVEQINIVNGVVQPPQLVFADPAAVDVQDGPPPKGKWKHAAIPNARPRQRLVIVLTKDGEVKALLQAIFK